MVIEAAGVKEAVRMYYMISSLERKKVEDAL